jgi:hypothetical protein
MGVIDLYFVDNEVEVRCRRKVVDCCDDLKFDNKFEVPVMHSTAIPEPLLRYT